MSQPSFQANPSDYSSPIYLLKSWMHLNFSVFTHIMSPAHVGGFFPHLSGPRLVLKKSIFGGIFRSLYGNDHGWPLCPLASCDAMYVCAFWDHEVFLKSICNPLQ